MLKRLILAVAAVGVVAMPMQTQATTYYTDSEYETLQKGIIYEDKGIVLENYPELGYLLYRNMNNETVRAMYHTSQIVVEKEGVHEQEDRIGYIDELFPYFEYDPRDTTIDNIKQGDNIYLRTDENGYVTYISAYNYYMLRYGKVISWQIKDSYVGELILEDDSGQIYVYEVELDTPVTKSNRPYAIGSIRAGEYVKLLVSQKTFGEGIVEEQVEEITVDGDTRVIDGIYKGQLLHLGAYDNTVRLAHAQQLQLAGWSSYTDIMTFTADPRTFTAYIQGQRSSWDYMSRYLTGSSLDAYVAIENYMGQQNVAIMNVQDSFQRTLDPSQAISVTPTEVRLLSGHTLNVGADAIVVKDDRLIGASNIIVGDTVQAVTNADGDLVVANILLDISAGRLEVFRGRITDVDLRENFVVETFSLLNDNEWYYHPQPRTFTLDYTTQFFNEDGFVQNGIEEFLGYGLNSTISEVYTVVASGDQALLVSDMPYTRQCLTGRVYKGEDDSLIYLKDVYEYSVDLNRWYQYSIVNEGLTVEPTSNSIIIRNGELISLNELQEGDRISVMMLEELDYFVELNGAAQQLVNVEGYIIIVE